MVLIPFALNVIWIAVLIVSVHKSEQMLDLERNQSDNMEHFYLATEIALRASGNLFSYIYSRNDFYKTEQHTDLTLAQKQLAYGAE